MSQDAEQAEWWWDEATRSFMPGTVFKMPAPGGVVYLVGTAHGQRSSIDDVAMVIRTVQPHVVCIEMCSSRVVLESDVTQPAVSGARALFDEDETEFHKALAEAQRLHRGCVLHLIDRPIGITASRIVDTLTVWDLLRIYWQRYLANHADQAVNTKDTEALRHRGAADRVMTPFAAAFPRLHHVLVVERDIFMTFRLQQATLPDLRVARPGEHVRAVAVVGLGHVTGIRQLFNFVTEPEATALLDVPTPRMPPLLVAGGLLAGGVSLAAVTALAVARMLADD